MDLKKHNNNTFNTLFFLRKNPFLIDLIAKLEKTEKIKINIHSTEHQKRLREKAQRLSRF